MAGATTDDWLGYALFKQKLSDWGCRYVAIHDGHLKVHQNQTKTSELSIICINISLNMIQSLESILCFNYYLLNIFDSDDSNDDLERHSVEGLIIHN